MVCLAIVATISALLTPVFARVKHAAQIQASVSNLHMMQTSLKVYQMDWEGDGNYGSPADMGLPTVQNGKNFDRLFPAELWKSPCGLNPGFADTALFDYCYRPFDEQSFTDYSVRYRENTLLVYDLNCDDHAVPLHNPEFSHRGLGVLLSGQLVNRYAPGQMDYSDEWWSSPPE